MCFLEESHENMQKIQILKFWERPLFNIREYAFNYTLCCMCICSTCSSLWSTKRCCTYDYNTFTANKISKPRGPQLHYLKGHGGSVILDQYVEMNRKEVSIPFNLCHGCSQRGTWGGELGAWAPSVRSQATLSPPEWNVTLYSGLWELPFWVPVSFPPPPAPCCPLILKSMATPLTMCFFFEPGGGGLVYIYFIDWFWKKKKNLPWGHEKRNPVLGVDGPSK